MNIRIKTTPEPYKDGMRYHVTRVYVFGLLIFILRHTKR